MSPLSRFASVLAFCLVLYLFNSPSIHAREWTDITGTYSIDAELFAFDDRNVVLRRADGELGVFQRDELSEADNEYLRSRDAEQINERTMHSPQTWKTTVGLELVGRVVDYTQRDVTIQRRRSRMYVNDRRFENLPEIYQKLLPKVIEHFEGIELPDRQAMQRWLLSLRGQPRTFHLDGVVMELENGDEYAIPFFVFSNQDRRLLQAGWANWLARQEQVDVERGYDSAYLLETLAAAYFEDQAINRQIALMNLNLQAIRAGITSAWEVTLYPAPGNPSFPRWVVVPGRDSAQATVTALQQNPGFVAGPVRRISR